MTKGPSEASGRTYWRSVERLLDSPALAARTPEFMDGADSPPDAVDRRTMLTLMGASFALAGLQGCRRPVEHIVPYVKAPEMIVPGKPRYYATTLPRGAEAIGLVVESHEGRPTKIEGNDLHPASGGAAGAWTQAAILDLYDPDRSRRHRHPVGDAASGEATWETVAAFLTERRAVHAESDGAGLAVLLGAHASPSLARATAALRAALPAARVVSWEPAGEENAARGLRDATGASLRARYHLERAQVVVDLDADLLGTAADAVAHARGFAAARRLGDQAHGEQGHGEHRGSGGEMLRLYAVESSPSVTGIAADHRLRVQRSRVPAVAAALAAALGEAGVAVPGASGAPVLETALASRVALIAADLAAAGPRGLVVAGRAQPAEAHVLAAAINQALGAIGTTVSLHAAPDVAFGDTEALRELTAAMTDGAISTLVVLGGNPVQTAPGDLGLAAALDRVEHVVHLSSHENETSRHAATHITEACFLETWGDARTADGTLSVVQPLIAPLFDGKSAAEILGLLAWGNDRPGYEIVRETWGTLVGPDEDAWQRCLHDGVAVLPSTVEAPPPVTSEAVAAAFAMAAGGSPPALEAAFLVSRSVFDGRLANNAWLQELPDPISKIVWDNAAFLSPATAAEHKVENGDVLVIRHADAEGEGNAIEVPAWILPGQADGSIGLELGYGRLAAGRVGDGVGVAVEPLRRSGSPWVTAVSFEKAGRRHTLVQTQEHQSMEGRPLVREADLATFRENPHFAADHHAGEAVQPFDSWHYEEGYQWGMAIDLNACIGCNACVVACQSENNIPVVGKTQVDRGREMHWLRIDRYFVGSADDPELAVQPVPCMHCENAPCEQVCPVAATVHDGEGLNAMVYNRCIGTRYCSNNCPYKVRRFNFFNYTKDTPELLKLAMNPDVTVRSRGVMEKCSYCLQRLNEAKIAAKHEGRAVRDGDVRTACQQTCPTDAIAFGNLNDPESRVVATKHGPRDYVLLGELNNRPRTSYGARVRNPHPAWSEA